MAVITKAKGEFFQVDDLTADNLERGEWDAMDKTFFAKPCKRNGEVTNEEWVELPTKVNGWSTWSIVGGRKKPR